MEKYADLRAVGPGTPGEPAGRPVLVCAAAVVPLLWPALFGYDECQIRRDGKLEVFDASAGLADARERARAVIRALPAELPLLVEAARRLARALKQAHGEQLRLHPVKLFSALPRQQQPVYLQRLFNLCELWERLRGGEPWEAVHEKLLWVDPAAEELLKQPDPDLAQAGFVGQLAAQQAGARELLVARGQDLDDLQPQALAVGDQGLVLGCFEGTWKLMSSGSDQRLSGVWGDNGSAFVVGHQGTALRLKQGRWSALEVPTSQNLNAVWGTSSGSVVAVGDGGTVLVFTGRRWQPWSVPTSADLHAVAGTGPEDIYVASGEATVLIYDGINWSSLTLPEKSQLAQLCSATGVIHGAGNSRWGGEVFSLRGKSVKQDKQLPTVKQLTGIWRGFGAGLGVLAPPAQVLVNEGGGWLSEALPVDRLQAVAAGARLLALGRTGEYSVILCRGEDGWQMEASVPRQLRLNALWVAGDPRPPRLEGK